MNSRRVGLAGVVAAAVAAPAAIAAASATTVPDTIAFPESVTVKPGSSTLFVSSFAGGAVARGKAGGALQPFLAAGADGRASATGLIDDGRGHLLVLTGSGLHLQVVDDRRGTLLGDLAAAPHTGGNLNDLVLDRAGDAYITDFGHPVIYRASARQLRAGNGTLRPWLRPRTSQVPDLPAGGNLNGIALTPDGKSLIVGQTGNGALYRITIATRAVSRIAVRGGALDGSDGIRIDGRTGYVVTHQRGVAVLSFSKSYARAKITKVLTDPSLSMPTSVTRVAGRLLVTNAIKAVGAPSYTLTSLKP